MGNRRLLDRVRDWNGNETMYSRQNPGRKVESVVQYLQKLLNSKQGTTLMDDAYGMPDFTDLTVLFPDSVRDIERSISETMQRYEPRLSQVKVDFVFQDEQSLSLLFQIHAVLKTNENELAVTLESAIDTNGKMKING